MSEEKKDYRNMEFSKPIKMNEFTEVKKAQLNYMYFHENSIEVYYAPASLRSVTLFKEGAGVAASNAKVLSNEQYEILESAFAILREAAIDHIENPYVEVVKESKLETTEKGVDNEVAAIN